jgi:hypothetical protein
MVVALFISFVKHAKASSSHISHNLYGHFNRCYHTSALLYGQNGRHEALASEF